MDEEGDVQVLNNVICAEDLQFNLLSLRRLVEQGLNVYLNDKVTDIFDPITQESFLRGLYVAPFWEIELRVNHPNVNNRKENRKLFVNLAEVSGSTHEDNTRSKGKIREITDNSNMGDNKVDESEEILKISEVTDSGKTLDTLATSEATEINNVKESSTDEANKSESRPDLLVSFRDRELYDIDQVPIVELSAKEFEMLNEAQNRKSYKIAVLWHVRLGHTSVNYLKASQRIHEELIVIKHPEFKEAVRDCEVCKIAKMKRKPFLSVRSRASKPLEIINADLMGPVKLVSYPKGYRFVSVFIDNFSRLAIAYPMKSKCETGECLEAFVKSCRNVYGEDLRVSYLETDQGTEFTGGYTRIVLDKLGADLRLACPDTPQHNGVAERFNQTLLNKLRAYMFDSGMPENSWDLAVNAAVYA